MTLRNKAIIFFKEWELITSSHPHRHARNPKEENNTLISRTKQETKFAVRRKNVGNFVRDRQIKTECKRPSDQMESDTCKKLGAPLQFFFNTQWGSHDKVWIGWMEMSNTNGLKKKKNRSDRPRGNRVGKIGLGFRFPHENLRTHPPTPWWEM